MHILIVDDNKELLFGLEKLLHSYSYNTKTANTLEKAQLALDSSEYNLIILDWLLPDGSGVEFLATLRKAYIKTPILLLSSKNEIEDKVMALDNGADDYLQKPFSNIELLARIRALLRRDSGYKKSEIQIKNLYVNFSTHKVLVDKVNITLTKKEFSLLELLLLNQHVVLTRYQLAEHLNPEFDSLKNSNLVDVHIKNLRQKLRSAAALIETIRGVGFKIQAM
jgi:DNA-binding response OmpR family regulator